MSKSPKVDQKPEDDQVLTPYITDIQVSQSKDEDKKFKKEGYQQVPGNLTEGAGGIKTTLWYKRSSCSIPITRIQISFKEEMIKGLEDAGYTQVKKNLNEGAEGNTIYLWFFRGDTEYDVPIVNLAVTECPDEEKDHFSLGWERLACNLNRRAGGNNIHLWLKRAQPTYFCNVTATVGFDKDAAMFRDGYIRVDEDANRGGNGDQVFIWYQLTTNSEMAIRDIQVSTSDDEFQSFKNAGYKQVKQDLNEGTKGSAVYLWYRQDNPITGLSLIVKKTDLEKYKDVVQIIKKNLNKGNDGCTEYLLYYRNKEPVRSLAVTDLAVSTEKEEEENLFLKGFTAVPQPLNKSGRGNPMYLWYKVGSGEPITRINFAPETNNTNSFDQMGYKKFGKNLNPVPCEPPIYMWYYKGSGEGDIPFTRVDVLEIQDENKLLSFGWQCVCVLPTQLHPEPYGYIYGKGMKPTYNRDTGEDNGEDNDGHINDEGSDVKVSGESPTIREKAFSS